MSESQLEFSVRSAVPSDLGVVRDIYRLASLSNENDREVLLRNPQAMLWSEDGITSGRTRVAIDHASQIVGFATNAIIGSGAELEDLFVDPGYRRRGIATLLVKDAVERARHSGFDRLEVTANPHAAEFYASAGFAWVADTDTEFGPAPRLSRPTGPIEPPS